MGNRLKRLLAVGLSSLALAAVPASAQVFTGRIDVTVLDATGAVLPGVTVELTGPLHQTTVTDAVGEAHFLNLPPGTYQVRATLQGFTEYQNQNVPVVAGGAVPLRVTLRVAGVAEQVEVTAESPVIDIKKQTTAVNVTLDELQRIPNARDPWVILQTVPSVIVDRVNIGGSESGQQSLYFGKGAGFGDNTWNLDGIPITDMAATGASPTYYDFDMFQEMQITTGGADERNPTPGVQLNFVLKSGTNTPHGSSRIYFENEDLQSNNLSPQLAEAIGGQTKKGNRTDQYSDYGVEVGGPIVRDKWWIWGSAAKTDVRILTLTNVLDRTILKNYALKSQAQLNRSVRVSYTFFEGNKVKDGRGASATRPTETTWDQSGPSYVNKFEGNFVAGSNFFFTARGAYSPMGFQLVPKGGLDVASYRDVGRVWHGSFLFFKTERPQKSVLGDGNYFRGRHELKFGFSWRRASVDSQTRWPGPGWYTLQLSSYPRDRRMLAIALRPRRAITEGEYWGGYVGDTVTLDRMTLNFALRVDRQTSSAFEAVQPALPGAPNLMPSVTVPAVPDAIKFNFASPRVGMTYALDQSRKTQLRASYALFASQLGAADAGFVSAASYAYVYYLAVDTNGNGYADANELLLNIGPIGYSGFDPSNPTSTKAFNRAAKDLTTPRTHEVIVGVDRELMPNFGINASVTYRRFTKLRWFPLIGVTRADYRQDGVVSGNLAPIGSFSVPYYALNPAKVPEGAGKEDANRPGYHQRYWGFEIQATKRLANRWMGRIGFSTNDHREYFDDPNVAIQDPTPTPTSPLKDGGLVVRQTGGSGKSQIYLISPRYQFIANGLWEGPWRVNVGGNLLVRQGYGMPFFSGLTETSDPVTPEKNVLVVGDVGDFRLPTVVTFDLRIEKVLSLNRANLAVDLDFFNLFNRGTVLGRQYDINATGVRGFNQVLEIMQPRIARIGVRLTF